MTVLTIVACDETDMIPGSVPLEKAGVVAGWLLAIPPVWGWRKQQRLTPFNCLYVVAMDTAIPEPMSGAAEEYPTLTVPTSSDVYDRFLKIRETEGIEPYRPPTH